MAKTRLVAKPLTLGEIQIYYDDSKASLILYFSRQNPKFAELFAGDSLDEVEAKLENRIKELDRSTSLSLLAAIESIFMNDCKERDRTGKTDALSVHLSSVVKIKKYVLLNDKILDVWKVNLPEYSKLITQLKDVLKYRHWLAHGRHFTPQMGQQDYDYFEIYQLAEAILNNFPFEGI